VLWSWFAVPILETLVRLLALRLPASTHWFAGVAAASGFYHSKATVTVVGWLKLPEVAVIVAV